MPAASRVMFSADHAEYTRLRMVLNSMVARGADGAAELRTQAQSITSRSDRFQFLKDRVAKPSSKRMEWAPSVGSQVHDVALCQEKFQMVRKQYRNRSIALKRTLAVYAWVREANLESELPLPALYHVHKGAEMTVCCQEYLGQDCRHFLPVSEKRFRELRAESTAALRAAGFQRRISRHKANWCLVPHNSTWRAMLIDVGNAAVNVLCQACHDNGKNITKAEHKFYK